MRQGGLGPGLRRRGITPRRVVVVAMPCAEVMEIGGTLDVFYAANILLAEAGASDPGGMIEVVSPPLHDLGRDLGP
jgi:hypothetical protein